MDNNDIIRGRRLTNAESNILNYPDLPIMDKEVVDEILAPFINTDTIKFENGSQIIYTSSANTNVRGNRSKIIGCICYDTETEQWMIKENFNITKDINRYIPEWMYDEWLFRKGNENEM